MIDPTEVAMLHAMANSPTDHLPRLVYADWLEERGNAARAEFIRVQCELHSPNLDETQRMQLLLRERDLLNVHRRDWCVVGDVELEDVVFNRGLISAARIKEWDDGAFLQPDVAPYFLNVQELDLSGLGLEDDDIRQFTEIVDAPLLKKLFLNDNQFTDVGAETLALCSRLPRLDVLYIFGNQISDEGIAALTNTTCLPLGLLDHGETADGYSMTAGQTEIGRRQYIRTQLAPHVEGYFQKYPLLQSAMLCVAQYWSDEATDAVHSRLIVSELYEPTLQNTSRRIFRDEPRDPNVPNTKIVTDNGEQGSDVSIWHLGWDDNNSSIPLWAAFTTEGAHQEYEQLSEFHSPAVIFYRQGGYRFLPMQRPHLDGIRPEWDNED
jgi:uncharacterized protein (TIGR02996 family)